MKITQGRQLRGLDDRTKTNAMQNHASRSLRGALENAEAGASSSKNERLNAARAGIERNGNTAPGSEVRLTAHGLLAGDPTEASHWVERLSSEDRRLYNASKKPRHFDRLSANEQARALKLKTDYSRIYRASSKRVDRSEAAAASSSSQGGYSPPSSRPTTGELHLTDAAIKRAEDLRNWQHEQELESWRREHGPGSGLSPGR